MPAFPRSLIDKLVGAGMSSSKAEGIARAVEGVGKAADPAGAAAAAHRRYMAVLNPHSEGKTVIKALSDLRSGPVARVPENDRERLHGVTRTWMA